MHHRDRFPKRKYQIYDLAEDFRLAIITLMARGFSPLHLDYVLDPLPDDVRSGDPPPPGTERFSLSWSPLPGQELSKDLNQALLSELPTLPTTYDPQTVTDLWDRTQRYILLSIRLGEV